MSSSLLHPAPRRTRRGLGAATRSAHEAWAEGAPEAGGGGGGGALGGGGRGLDAEPSHASLHASGRFGPTGRPEEARFPVGKAPPPLFRRAGRAVDATGVAP